MIAKTLNPNNFLVGISFANFDYLHTLRLIYSSTSICNEDYVFKIGSIEHPILSSIDVHLNAQNIQRAYTILVSNAWYELDLSFEYSDGFSL